ncbi:MAG: flagellar biosynthetic protein FliO [Verrucomicrobiota bacterium]|jgi:flagellar biogenesis protein FliO
MILESAMARIKALAQGSALAWWGVMFLAARDVSAESSDPSHRATLPSVMPDVGASIFRICGAFILVVALFLAGVWLFRNWQRLAAQKHGGAKLNVIEVKSLGQRHAIYVVGYQQQRMLLASSPAGVAFLSHLPSAEVGEHTPTTANVGFADALKHVLSQRQ